MDAKIESRPLERSALRNFPTYRKEVILMLKIEKIGNQFAVVADSLLIAIFDRLSDAVAFVKQMQDG